jgi:ubiquinone/menaquinone biosynthesis C-methylase UbiE
MTTQKYFPDLYGNSTTASRRRQCRPPPIMTPAQALALIDNPPLRALAHPTRWADLGCGSGLFTLTLASLLQSRSTVYAVDRHPTIAQQSTPNQVSIQPQKNDFVKKDLGLRDLDGILMANSFHYVKDKPALLKTLKAILRPAHYFLIVEYDRTKPVPVWVPYPLAFAALESLFRAAGYQTITRIGQMPSAFGGSNLYGAVIS